MPLRNSRNGWHCTFSADGITVSTARKSYGKYNLLAPPYCSKCSLPGVSTNQCRWHWKDEVERTYAMGPYLPLDREDSKDDPLSQHIRGLKQFISYSVPLGWAMSLCIENVYHELRGIDMLVPIPKHSSEFKVDRTSKVQYNQAEELAKIIGRDINVSVAQAVLKTQPHSQREQGSWRDRVEIPAGVYSQNPEVDVRNKTILLIDDVRTSGGTTSVCALLLLKKGAKRVNAYVAGRETLRDWGR